MPDYEALNAAIDAASRAAYGSETDSELAQSRADALDRYFGRNINPAPAGRAQIRDRSTFETIEWMKPSLMRIFASSDTVAQFDPEGPDDEAQAAQESDYCNYVVTRQNNWPQIIHDYAHDGLTQKNGYLWPQWDATKQVESEFYEAISDDAYASLTQDPLVDVVAHEQEPDEVLNAANAQSYQQAQMLWQQQAQMAMAQGQQAPQPPQPPPPAFRHTVEIKRTREAGRIKLRVLAPERCLIDTNAPDHTLDGADYFEFFDFATVGSLRAAGLEIDDEVGSFDDSGRNRFSSPEELARDDGTQTQFQGSAENSTGDDPSMRVVKVRYIWIRHDYDGDGVPEMQHVIRVGQDILFRQETPEIDVASWSPIPQPHRHIGLSMADAVADIEDINTNITRAGLDNLNLANTPRIAASDRVNMADLLDVRVGGIIRVDGQPPQELMPLVQPDTFGSAMQAVAFFDQRRQNRTGINAYFQGTDANALNKTASGISQLTNSAAQRVELVGRFLSIGVARVFDIVHRLTLQHDRKARVLKLRGKWTNVDPSEWKRRTSAKITVGLGTGSKDATIASLMNIWQAQQAAMPMGIASRENMYRTLIELAKSVSIGAPESFFTDPAGKPAPQPPPDPILQKTQMELQMEAQKTQHDAQIKQQSDEAKRQFDMQMEQMRQEHERWKAQLEAQVKLQIESMKAEAAQASTHAQIGSAERLKAIDMQREDAARAQEAEKESQDDAAEAAKHANTVQQIVEQFSQLMSARQPVKADKIRGPNGRLVAVRRHYADGTSNDISINDAPLQ